MGKKGWVVLAALAVMALLWRFGRHGEQRLDAPHEAASAAPHETTAASSAEQQLPFASLSLPQAASPATVQPPQAVSPQPAKEAQAGRVDALSAYLASAVYPPDSRPLTHHHTDLLYPNKRHEIVRPSAQDDASSYRFSADAYWVAESRPLNVWLESYHHGKPRVAELLAASLTIVGEDGASLESIPLPLKESNGRLEVVLQLHELIVYDGPVRIRFWSRFRIGRGGAEEASFHVVYTPAAAIPARFNGAFETRISDGSLCIDVGVDVTAAGHYLIDANLRAADEPLAWTRFKRTLLPGQQQVPLCFFGKVLIDKGLSGPYRLTELRGALLRPAAEPDLLPMAWFDGVYQTPDVSLSELSDVAYHSDHKRRKVAMLRTLQRRGAGADIYRPTRK